MPQFLFVKQILQSNNDYQQYQELLETVLNRHLSLFSLDLTLIIMQSKSNPPWWILFTTIHLFLAPDMHFYFQNKHKSKMVDN